MENNASVILAIFIAAVIMFGYPLITMAGKTDKAAQVAVEATTNKYVDTIRTTGKVKYSDYEAYLKEISSTGNSFDVELELQSLDENASKKATQGQGSVQNKSTYTTYYTTQILDMVKNNNGTLLLKEGDIITAKVTSTNTTIFQQLTKYLGKNSTTGAIVASSSGVVTTTAQ